MRFFLVHVDFWRFGASTFFILIVLVKISIIVWEEFDWVGCVFSDTHSQTFHTLQCSPVNMSWPFAFNPNSDRTTVEPHILTTFQFVLLW